ncbi:hypothetical protein [Caproicibacter fermentans]|uniref:t-SNARE coiled-coil homology domain-containing protein n=1 Tax=Caproicibacter fermentans TaxID=2576756 RepID=A0A7G8TE31_9FIRM|nr:hypothetical protein [Caproicibacter fermentans]QNK41872.1 hypothetical protein HCR03_06450 [Caproicibacter fermentans]
MLDKNDLHSIAQLMDLKLQPINGQLDSMGKRFDFMGNRLDSMEKRLDSMEKRLGSMEKRLGSIDERLSSVEEDTKVTRNAVNDLIEWADDASIQIVPLFKKSK